MRNQEFDELVNYEKELWDQYRALKAPTRVKLNECRVAKQQVKAETYRRQIIQEMIIGGEISLPNIENRDAPVTTDYSTFARQL